MIHLESAFPNPEYLNELLFFLTETFLMVDNSVSIML